MKYISFFVSPFNVSIGAMTKLSKATEKENSFISLTWTNPSVVGWCLMLLSPWKLPFYKLFTAAVSVYTAVYWWILPSQANKTVLLLRFHFSSNFHILMCLVVTGQLNQVWHQCLRWINWQRSLYVYFTLVWSFFVSRFNVSLINNGVWDATEQTPLDPQAIQVYVQLKRIHALCKQPVGLGVGWGRYW